MYADYSQPLFGKTKVLRGGAWTTRGRMIRNTWRTYYGPERNDVFAGFRTCAR
jgi:iron(II)-dependent oxidoreductase